MLYPILLTFVLTVSVAACSPSPSDSSQKAASSSAPSEAIAVAPVASAKAEEAVLNFSNWIDYIPETMLKDFETETGIKVNYRTYATNEVLENQVRSKTDSDDLVVPSLNYGKTQASQGYYQALNKQLLPNYKNLDPKFMKSMELSDPGNKYFVPWAWGHTTVFVNKTQVTKALAGLPYPEKELDLVFNPAYTSRLKSCGIAYLDSPSEIIPLAMHYLGIPPYSQNVDDFKKASAMLKSIRKDIGTFSPKMIDVMSSNKTCVAIAWSGDINTSIAALKKSGNKDELVGLLPKQGTLMFIDGLVIPVNAKHPKNAHAFIDFYLKAKNSARMSNETSYPNGNSAALEFINADIKANPMIFPPQEFFSKLVPTDGYSNNARWAMMQEYIAFAFKIETK
jgi:putrescine transport system substrate-binding protein